MTFRFWSSFIFPGWQSSAKGSSAQNSGFCKSSYKLRLTKSRKLINSHEMRKNQTWVHRFSSSDLTWDYKVTKCKDNVTNHQSSTKGKKNVLMSTLPEGYPCSRWAVFEGVSCRGIGNGPSSPSPNVVGTLNPSEPLMFLWIHPSQHKCQASSCIICWSNQPCNVLNPSEPADVMLVKLCIHPNQLINIYVLAKPTSFHCSFSVQKSSISSLPLPPTCKITLNFCDKFSFLDTLSFLDKLFLFGQTFPFWTNFSFLDKLFQFWHFSVCGRYLFGEDHLFELLSWSFSTPSHFGLFNIGSQNLQQSRPEVGQCRFESYGVREEDCLAIWGDMWRHTCEKSHKCNYESSRVLFGNLRGHVKIHMWKVS